MDPIHSDAAELASITILRYPRTVHLEGSRLQDGDDREYQRLTELAGCHAVIEEKIDGANTGISFTPGGRLLLQSRGHYLQGGARERQFALLHQWARAHEDALLERLEDRYVMYGEWAFAKHSVWYDRLPHYFHEFDVWDRVEQCFLSTARRRELLQETPVLPVPVLYEGEMPTRAPLLWGLVRHSLAKSNDWRERFEQAVCRHGQDLALGWRQTDRDDRGEGLYVKIESEQRVLGRFKLVRPNFIQTLLDSGSHHSTRPILPNGLASGVDLFAPRLTLTWEALGLQTLRGLHELAPVAPEGRGPRRYGDAFGRGGNAR